MSSVEDTYDLSPDFPQEEIIRKLYENSSDQMKKYKIKKFRFALSFKQIKELLETASSYSRTHELIIDMQWSTGLRVGELVHLRFQDLNLTSNTITINTHIEDEYTDTWYPKTSSGRRIITMPETLVRKLKGYSKDEKRKRGYFFISHKGSLFREESVIGFINKYACSTSSIGHNIGSHTLRRTYASYLAHLNKPIGEISYALGHKSIEITMKYLYKIESAEAGKDLADSIESIRKKIGI